MLANEALRRVLAECVENLKWTWPEKTVIEPPKDPKHGDLSTNMALLLAKPLKKNPRELANTLAQELMQRSELIAKAEAAGPGFCNVTLAPSFWQSVVTDIEALGDHYGEGSLGAGQKVLVEFVSANPTGPLHVGHGRGAAVGDSLARLLKAAGYTVDTEYYLNDAGRQMRLLGLSVWLRARELQGLDVEFPEEYYRGDYIIDIAKNCLAKMPDLLSLDPDEAKDKCYLFAMQSILDGIVADLADFRVYQDRFFSEKSLVEDKSVDDAFRYLDGEGLTYEQDHAYWFKAKQFGDDRDRVLRKSDGSLTYFASDIAYHHNKYARGYDWLIDVWGADHHGYIPRMRGAISAMNRAQESFDVVLIQLVNLIKDGKPVSMSTRAGTFETLHDVVKEVGVDATRFMFLSRKSDSPLDFDLDLVRTRNMENPVYYVQYAHARICGLLRRAVERGVVLPDKIDADILKHLSLDDDLALLKKEAQYPEIIASAAKVLGVHHVSRYLMELSGLVHSFYAKQQILGTSDQDLILARLAMLRSVAKVIKNGLGILGVEAPEQML
ncbi:MAG: arginine--tRNA ligase [Desulfovibrionaceae bacterium]|nr:arginine--tRNA ligase [Desulfovibrionaceae bacterium]